MADITTACGTCITDSAWCRRQDQDQISPYQFPIQGHPSLADWNLWHEALAATIGNGGQTLYHHLGKWHADAQPSNWWYDPTTEHLFHKDQVIQCYPCRPRCPSWSVTNWFATTDGFIVATLPPTAKKAMVQWQCSFIVLTGYGELVSALEEEQATTLQEYIASKVHPDAHWVVSEILSLDNGKQIMEALCNGEEIAAVSDGSFKNGRGTASWIVQAADSEGEVCGVCLTPSQESDQSSYHSELAGLFGLVTIIMVICDFHQVHKGCIQIACDGLSALCNATSSSDVMNPWHPQFDLVLAIHRAIYHSGLEWVPTHVKGHQDDNAEALLDRWALLNIDMD